MEVAKIVCIGRYIQTICVLPFVLLLLSCARETAIKESNAEVAFKKPDDDMSKHLMVGQYKYNIEELNNGIDAGEIVMQPIEEGILKGLYSL